MKGIVDSLSKEKTSLEDQNRCAPVPREWHAAELGHCALAFGATGPPGGCCTALVVNCCQYSAHAYPHIHAGGRLKRGERERALALTANQETRAGLPL